MSSVVVFKGKRREEILVIGDIRILYSHDDVFIEDFYTYRKIKQYAIYDMNGNLLETNIDGCSEPLKSIYNDNIKVIKLIIKEFGVDV